ncbi:hypothetical protein OG896_12280 [Streptomyces sp. NBC_00669]|uniref:hypothetical protein n=1 Tax=unclassified Streptomyces TaxID=2593676 RepID=UPI002E37AAA6|nr:hypothetical protein [Streptomyces sp. NBC_00669]
MAPRTKFSAAAGTLTAAALLLTACGGGHDKKIASSPTPSDTTASQTTAPPTTPAADPSAPTFDFPSDFKIVVAPDKTGDPTKDAVLRDQGYAVQAIYLAITKLDKTLPVFTKYVTQDASEGWSASIDAGKKDDRSITGTLQIYNRKVTVSSSTVAAVSFCEDQSAAYDKNLKTGKAVMTTPSITDFVFHTSRMLKGTDGIWHTTTYNNQKGATQCKR